jgi:quercetin dioxygenase-like cupin family protein
MKRILVGALVFFPFLSAAAADSVNVWTSHEVDAKLAATKPEANKITQDSLGSFAGYSMSVTKREASGIGELHKSKTDIFVVESGECTLITGGKLVSPKNQSPVEVRGASIEGGAKHHLTAGDVIRIPPNVPHQMLLDSGKQIVYAVVKVDVK